MPDPVNVTDPVDMPNPAAALLGAKARAYLLGVAAFCATSFAYVGIRFTALAKQANENGAGSDVHGLSGLDIVLWVVVACVMMMPLAAPALMPRQWPRPAAWIRRACALYTPFPILLALNALRYSVAMQQQENEMAASGVAIAGLAVAALATAGCVGALGVMLWPDLRGLARRLRGS